MKKYLALKAFDSQVLQLVSQVYSYVLMSKITQVALNTCAGNSLRYTCDGNNL
jgi:hypothetical protein